MCDGNKNSLSASKSTPHLSFSRTLCLSRSIGNLLIWFEEIHFSWTFDTHTFMYLFSAVYLYDLRYLISFIKLFSFSFIESHVIINQINFHFIHQFWLQFTLKRRSSNEEMRVFVFGECRKTIWLTKKSLKRRLNNFLHCIFDYEQTQQYFPFCHLLCVCVFLFRIVFLAVTERFPFRHHFPIDQNQPNMNAEQEMERVSEQ